MVSVLPSEGHAAANLVEPVGYQGQVVDSYLFRSFRRLEHGETFPVEIERKGESQVVDRDAATVCLRETGDYAADEYRDKTGDYITFCVCSCTHIVH